MMCVQRLSHSTDENQMPYTCTRICHSKIRSAHFIIIILKAKFRLMESMITKLIKQCRSLNTFRIFHPLEWKIFSSIKQNSLVNGNIVTTRKYTYVLAYIVYPKYEINIMSRSIRRLAMTILIRKFID